jgi:hypothetical protein
MTEGKGRKEEARDRLVDELWLAAIAIGVIVIREAVKRTPDAIEWGARNAPKAARAAGQAGSRAAGAAKQGALTIGKGVMTRLGGRRSELGDVSPSEDHGKA